MARRAFKPRYRSSNVRDARLIVIATEGMATEKQYFEALVSPEYYQNSKVHVTVLTRDKTESAPDRVIEQLNQFKRTYDLKQGDELWMVIDVDRWGNEKLSMIAAQCIQKKYQLAVSNPAFELWLLLHLTMLDEYSQTELDEFLANKKIGSRTRLNRELLRLLGNFNSSRVETARFLPYVQEAIERAKNLETNIEHRWTSGLGSRVYLLVEKIIKQ